MECKEVWSAGVMLPSDEGECYLGLPASTTKHFDLMSPKIFIWCHWFGALVGDRLLTDWVDEQNEAGLFDASICMDNKTAKEKMTAAILQQQPVTSKEQTSQTMCTSSSSSFAKQKSNKVEHSRANRRLCV